MKKYVSFMTLLFVLLSFSLFPSNILGQSSERPEKDVLRGPPSASENFLNLTPKQRSKLEELRKMNYEERREFLKNMQALRQEIRKLMQDPEANEKEIIELYGKISKLQSSQFSKFIQHRKERRKIFTPEQLEKLEKFKSRIGQRRDFMRGRFLARRGFARDGAFPHCGRRSLFRGRGRNFRGRPFMNRWQWWRYNN